MEWPVASSSEELFEWFQNLAGEPNSDWVFRGHQNADWELSPTFNRDYFSGMPENEAIAIEHCTNRFFTHLSATNEGQFIPQDRRGRLELARHLGAPSPLLDFTYSPHVALWFAFNRLPQRDDTTHCRIYGLNASSFSIAFESLYSRNARQSFIDRYGCPPFEYCRWDRVDPFSNGYPYRMWNFLNQPASWNTRMRRQMGCFVYGAGFFSEAGATGLETIIEQNSSFARVHENAPILDAMDVPHSMVTEIFERLELMNINGSLLFDNDYGAVCDATNEKWFQSRRGVWDQDGWPTGMMWDNFL